MSGAAYAAALLLVLQLATLLFAESFQDKD